MNIITAYRPKTKVQIAWSLRRLLRNRHGFKVQPKGIRPFMRQNKNAIAWMDARSDKDPYDPVINQYRFFPKLWHFQERKNRKYGWRNNK